MRETIQKIIATNVFPHTKKKNAFTLCIDKMNMDNKDCIHGPDNLYPLQSHSTQLKSTKVISGGPGIV